MSRGTRSHELFLPFLAHNPHNLRDKDYFAVIHHFFSELYRINRLHSSLPENADSVLIQVMNEALVNKVFFDDETTRLRQWFMDQRFQVLLASLYHWGSGGHQHLSYLFHTRHHLKTHNSHPEIDGRVILSPLIFLYNVIGSCFIDRGPVGAIDMMSALLQGMDSAVIHQFFDNVHHFSNKIAILEGEFGKYILDISSRDIIDTSRIIDSESLKLIKMAYVYSTDWLIELENKPANRVVSFILNLYDCYRRRKNNILHFEDVRQLLYDSPFYGLSHIADTNDSLWISKFIKILMTVLYVIKDVDDLPHSVLDELHKTFKGVDQALLNEAIIAFKRNPFFELLWNHLIILLTNKESTNDISEQEIQECSVEVITAISHNFVDIWNVSQCKTTGNNDNCLRQQSELFQLSSQRHREAASQDSEYRQGFVEKKKLGDRKTILLSNTLRNDYYDSGRKNGLDEGIKKGMTQHQTLIRAHLKKIGFGVLLVLGVAALIYLTVQTLGASLVIVAASAGVWAGVGSVAAVGAGGLTYQYKEKIKAIFKKRKREDGPSESGESRRVRPTLAQTPEVQQPTAIPPSASAQMAAPELPSASAEGSLSAEQSIVAKFKIKMITENPAVRESENVMDLLAPMRQRSKESSDVVSARSLADGAVNLFTSQTSKISLRSSPVLENEHGDAEGDGYMFGHA